MDQVLGRLPRADNPNVLVGFDTSDDAGVYRLTPECGLVQTVDMLQQADPTRKIFCINPNLVSLQKVTETTVNWIKKKPARLDEDAYKLVTESLHANYPCDSPNI